MVYSTILTQVFVKLRRLGPPATKGRALKGKNTKSERLRRPRYCSGSNLRKKSSSAAASCAHSPHSIKRGRSVASLLCWRACSSRSCGVGAPRGLALRCQQANPADAVFSASARARSTAKKTKFRDTRMPSGFVPYRISTGRGDGSLSGSFLVREYHTTRASI
jgi:hypothetical protein